MKVSFFFCFVLIWLVFNSETGIQNLKMYIDDFIYIIYGKGEYMDNTIILVDYDNVYVTLKNYYRNILRPDIMYDVITEIRKRYNNDNVLSIKLFADFQKVQISDVGYEILKENHVEIEHVFNGKNASDVILMINCMKYMMQYPHISKIVLVSSDSDIVPIFHEVQLLNKKLEVLYFDVNTGAEHKKHIKEVGIPNMMLEALLSVPVYIECDDIDEFYNLKKSDITLFTKQLQAINDIIEEEYNKYLKKDVTGNIISGGGTGYNTLLEGVKNNCVCPAIELSKNQGGKYTNFLDMLQSKNILYRYDFVFNNKNFYTFLLNENVLSQLGIVINNLKRECDF